MIRRTAAGLGLLVVLSGLVFLGTDLLPGDAAAARLGRSATPAALAALRDRLGLDLPFVTRYVTWLLAFVRGDLGSSLMNGRSVAESIAVRLGNTLFLAGVSAVVAIPLSIGLGLLSVCYQGRWLDRGVTLLTRASVALPEFFVGYLLIFVLSIRLGLFASSSPVVPSMGLGDRLAAIVLPCLTLIVAVAGHIATIVRASVLDVMSKPYIEMAVLKGLSHPAVICRHALPNAVSPIANAVLTNLAYLFVGAVVVEVVFVYPGLGQFMVDSVVKRDAPAVQATSLLFSAIYIGLNLLADILSVLLNPRLSFEP